MLDDFDNENNLMGSNIHRIKRIKSGTNRPTTGKNRLNSNKEFINNLKKGNLDYQNLQNMQNYQKFSNTNFENQNKLNEFSLSNRSKNNNKNLQNIQMQTNIPNINNNIHFESENNINNTYNNNNNNKSELEKLMNINEENPFLEFQLQQTSKLKNIDLIESNYEDLYGWKSLFCKSRPISCYTHVNKNSNLNYKINKISSSKVNNNMNSEEQKNMSVTMTQNSQLNLASNSNENSTFNERENNFSEIDENNIKEKFEIISKKKKIRHPFRDNIPELNNNYNNNNDFQKLMNSTNGYNNNEMKEKEKSGEKKKSDFVFPVALIDEQEEKLFEYITIPKNVSDRRKKMDNFVLLAAKALKKNKKKKGGSVIKIKNRSNSMTNSMIDFASKKNVSMQATSSPLRNKNNTLLRSRKSMKSNNNISAISQSLNFNKNEMNSAIRPMSVYAKRSDNAVYYMSKEFSDYFKQDLKEFCDKFNLLHPKIKCDNKKIKKLLEEIKKVQDEDEKIIKNFKIDDDDFNLKDLELAGNSKNILPLLKNFLKKYYSEDEVRKIFNDKIYPISSRPLTTRPKLNDNKFNLRGKIMSDLKENIEKNEDKLKLEIDTYDKNDPDLKIFENDLEEHEDFEIPNLYDKESVQPLHNVIEERSIEKENISNSNVDDILDITKDKESFMKSNNFSDEKNRDRENIKEIPEFNTINKNDLENVNVNFKENNNNDEFNKEKKINKRPKTAFINKKNMKTRLNSGKPEKIIETEEKSEIFLEKKISKARNLNLKLNINERNISPIKVMSYKGIIHPYSYKMMNLNKKNQNNFQENNNSSSVLSNALTVQNLHKKVIGNPNMDFLPEKKSAPIVFENIDIKQVRRPTTSKWNSNVSNISSKLNNPYHDKANNEKNKTNRNKVNNVYFNSYIDMQFKPSNVFNKTATTKNKLITNPNVSNRDESYNFINPTANEKFSSEKFGNNDRKNVNETKKIRAQSAMIKKNYSRTTTINYDKNADVDIQKSNLQISIKNI